MVANRDASSLELDQLLQLLHGLVLGAQAHESVCEKRNELSQLIWQIVQSMNSAEVGQAVCWSLAPLHLDIANVGVTKELPLLLSRDVLDVHRRQAAQILSPGLLLNLEQFQLTLLEILLRLLFACELACGLSDLCCQSLCLLLNKLFAEGLRWLHGERECVLGEQIFLNKAFEIAALAISVLLLESINGLLPRKRIHGIDAVKPARL